MDPQPLVAVHVPLVGDERRKNWAKVVVAVDDAKASGWAYQGEFIAVGGVQDVPARSVVMVYGERGSRANPQVEVRVYTANADGTLSFEASAKGRAWARTLRDPVQELLSQSEPAALLDWRPELALYSDEALRQELDRRSGSGQRER